MTDLRAIVEAAARSEGFEDVAIVRLEDFFAAQDGDYFSRWLDRGFAGEMNYLKGERAEKRRHPGMILEGARSAICVTLNYNTDAPRSVECRDPSCGWVSRYAWGSDYHDVLKKKLDGLLERMRSEIPGPFEARAYVDTGPILERALARQSPLGWVGKNTCLINERRGSWLFIGEILTTLEFPGNAATPAADRCGTCTRCIDACPTQAITEPRVLDATRCISYWTIEFKAEFPQEIAAGLGRHVFGCDICQDVCPWNRRAPATHLDEFQARAGLVNPPLEELAAMAEGDFREKFKNSPVRRLGFKRFQRNVRAAIANSTPES